MPNERDAIERWADDHFTQGEVAVVMRLVDEFGWRPPRPEHTLEGAACSCGHWQAELGESIHRGFDRHLLEEREPEGCDCAELCEMGPTCPGGMLARLPGSGCGR